MKRRFEVTLLAVAIASLSAAAYAMAPTISEFRSPIIADDTPVTNSNDFVYPDAINLDTQGSDPDNTVPASGIIWSFTSLVGNAVSDTYRLDNRPPMDIAGGDNPNAPGTKEVGKASAGDDPEQRDGNPRTVTFRNYHLSPTLNDTTTGTMLTELDGHPGFAPQYTRVITMFASDGTTYSVDNDSTHHPSFLIYTYKNGIDHLSQPAAGGLESVVAPQVPLPSGAIPWVSESPFTGFAGFTDPTITSSATGGLCIHTPLAPSSTGSWFSPFGTLPLAANQVYRIRINVSSPTPLAVNTTPLWDFTVDNTDVGSSTSPAHTQAKYGGDFFFWDNANGANSAGADASSGEHQFDIWWCPLAINSPGWNDSATGEFSTAKDPENDGRLQFRLLDTVQNPDGSGSAVDGQSDAGTLCMTSFQIDRIDYSSMTVSGAPVYNMTTSDMTFTNFHVQTELQPSGVLTAAGTAGDTTAAVSGGMVITPNVAGAWDTLTIVDLWPGDGTYDALANTGLTDDFPVPYQSNQLYRFTAGIQAPDANSQTHPPDVIRMDIDTPGNEVGEQNIMGLFTDVIGGPTTSAVTDYATFYFTHHVPAAGNPSNWSRLRPEIGAIGLNSLHALGYHEGGFKITYEKVELMDTSAYN